MTLDKKNSKAVANCIILASGIGSNALNIIDYFSLSEKSTAANIAALVSNVATAPVIEKSKKIAPFIPVLVLPYGKISERETFEYELEKLIIVNNIDFIILAGFMKVLSEEFVLKHPNKIVNIHPSLLPAFKGMDAIKSAYDYGVKFTGVTVHYVTKEVDSGPIISQEIVKIEDNDTVESLEEKIHKAEHKIYPVALELAICGE